MLRGESEEETCATRVVDRGDVLVFLPGEKQIREAQDAARRTRRSRPHVLPLIITLSFQTRSASLPHMHVVAWCLATVAETSLTIPGVRAVIDTGLARTSRYNPRAKIQRLPIEPISQANAEQRKGRCGREAPGFRASVSIPRWISTRDPPTRNRKYAAPISRA